MVPRNRSMLSSSKRARDRREEVDALEERVDLDRGLRRRREGALGALARRAEAAHRARVARDILLMFP